MKKVRLHILTICILILTCGFVVYAWYDNNRVTSAKGSNSIKVSSTGALQIAFAEKESGELNAPENAVYSDNVRMELSSAGFDDITGSGLTLYSPVFTNQQKLDPDFTKWTEETATREGKTEAGADRASCSTDSGKYVLLDIFFRSDIPMDIYLTNESSITPKTNNNGNDWVKKVEGQIEYGEGLQNLNINQSYYGYFSRNLIAGATRVSFSNYSISYQNNTLNYSMESYPDLVWVPNSSFQLTLPSLPKYLHTFNLKGTKESSYSYYEVVDNALVKYTIPRDSTGAITGMLRRMISDTESVSVPHFMVGAEGKLVPANVYPLTDSEKYIPAIYLDGTYVDAKYYKNVLYKAKRDINYNTAYWYTKDGVDQYAIAETVNGVTTIYKVHLEGGYWVKTVKNQQYVIIPESEILPLLVKDSSKYFQTNWMEDEFVSTGGASSKISRTPIASATFSYLPGGPYYARARIAVWVEGTDREADISLNGGEFEINLAFLGIAREQN